MGRPVPAEAIACRDGVLPGGRRTMRYEEALARHFGMPGGELAGDGAYRPERFDGPLGGATLFWEYGAGAAAVRVDADTGTVRVLAYVTAADVGRAVNPTMCEGQHEGAAMQGLGHALVEEFRHSNGHPLNAGLLRYRVPLIADLPDVFGAVLVEQEDGPGPYGIKGAGESGIVSVPAAVAHAVAAATGVRITDLPLTPERVWRALRQAAAGRAATGTVVWRSVV